MTKKMITLFSLSLILALLLVACGGNNEEAAGEEAAGEEVAAGDATAGKDLFVTNCSSCHGTDAKGLPNLGKNLTTSQFVEDNSDQELLAFVKQGRPASHPDNTTGVDMPPKGGNPALTDEAILDIIAYIRSIHE
jgi:disulfide bond formation protein DsbB